MKKVLVLNGSPRGENSGTMVLTNAFLEGMKLVDDYDIDIVNLSEKHIEFCKGCFYCWNNSNSECAIKDDMAELCKKHMEADIYIWSTPLHTFGMSAIMKNYLDRLLPLHYGDMGHRASGGDEHVCRYDKYNRQQVLICTCGFFSYENNVESLVKMFEIMREDNFSKIICSEGGIIKTNQGDLKKRVNNYKKIVRKAGKEFATNGVFSEETKQMLLQPMLDRDRYIRIVNNYWNVDLTRTDQEYIEFRLIKIINCLAALMDCSAITDEIGILQFDFTDLNKSVQVHINDKYLDVVEDSDRFVPYNLNMETTSHRLIELDNSVRKFSTNETSINSNVNGMQTVVQRLNWCMKNNKQRTMKF